MTYKSLAYKILKEADKPLHVGDIMKTLRRKHPDVVVAWGSKNPQATMVAIILRDINGEKKNSRFVKDKVKGNTFSHNPAFKESREKAREEFPIRPDISTKGKGEIAEMRVAELITLYGKEPLACHRPIADDDGIDFVVKQKGGIKTLNIQVKSRFGSGDGAPFVQTVKADMVSKKLADQLAIVFCLFDTSTGDIGNVWFVPARDFLKHGKRINGGRIQFVAGLTGNKGNKWGDYLIDKRGLADKIVEHMKKSR